MHTIIWIRNDAFDFHLAGGCRNLYTVPSQFSCMIDERAVGVTLPKGLIAEMDKPVNIDGLFLSKSDILRYGVRLTLLLIKGAKTLEEVKKEVRDNL